MELCKEQDEGDGVVPSVCWCPEVTVMSGPTAVAWCALRTHSFVDQAAQGRHALPTRAVVAHNDRVEDEIIDHDAGSDAMQPSANELVGLSRHATGTERIVKYGTLLRARAVSSARQRATDGDAA